MDRVAAEAEVAKSVAYAIFGSQAGLQHALMAREQQRGYAAAAECVAAMAAHADDLPAAARAGLTAFLTNVAAAPDSWRLIVLPIAGAPESVREAVAAGRERWRRELEPLAAAVLERQGITGIDAEIVAHLLRGNAEYLARLMLENPARFRAERLLRFGDELIARLVSGRGA